MSIVVDPLLMRTRDSAGNLVVRLGVGLLDEYLEFVAGRSRPNTVLAAGSTGENTWCNTARTPP